MKKTAITVAMLGLAAASSNALADGNETASVTLTHAVPLVCNIGLLATGPNDTSLGEIAELSSGHNKILELNNISESGGSQPISGAVKCNSNDGYSIDVSLAQGGLFNSDGGDKIPYTLTPEVKNGPELQVSNASFTYAVGANMNGVFTSDYEPGEQQFKLTLKTDPGAFDNAGSGHYTETITFSLVAL
ncbi:hypothetical protein [Vibrio sp. CK2-1]|uniref:hypothetical protein n=1 Tax=Vibrio sp. CK2-1 TaxID=2912249 RepID=UPI001F46068E|nr:hypothetical protein [Vibrio sp. CK2-1]MCF7352721.1 hypothetical protein [Vibrio sp. CK2-1]